MVSAVSATTYAPARVHPTWRAELLAVTGFLAVFVALLAPTLDNPLLERHDFRQTQTAFPARIFHEEGIDLLHPQVPVLGEPFEILFEFPLYQAAASMLMGLGVAEDTSLRATALGCFLATALLLYGLVRHLAGRVAAIGSLVAFVVTPYAVVWSRASMIEYLAAAGAVGFVWAFVAWRDNRRTAMWGLCLLCGLVAMLVKPTTAVFWLIPALGYRPTGPKRTALRRDPWTAALLALPVCAAAAWTLHADAVKDRAATTRWLTSSGLREWFLGTPGQRLDPAVWEPIFLWYALFLVGPVGLMLLVAATVELWRAEQRRFWVGIACAAFLPPLALPNLYRFHDYYLTAVAPALAALVGLGAALVVEGIRRRRASLGASVVAGATAIALLAAWFDTGYPYWSAAYNGGGSREAAFSRLADELERVTRPSDLVAAYGLDWNPAVFYYAHRKGHMVVAENEPLAYDLIDRGPYAHLIALDPDAVDPDLTSRWVWIGALGEHTYALADNPAALSGARFVSAERSPAADAHLAGAPSVASRRTLDCNRSVRLAAGLQGTWLELRDPPRTARIAVPTLASLPARRLVFVARELSNGGSFTIACRGADRLAITSVKAAGPAD